MTDGDAVGAMRNIIKVLTRELDKISEDDQRGVMRAVILIAEGTIEELDEAERAAN